jgi:II/X family phage/plasmid replication protein
MSFYFFDWLSCWQEFDFDIPIFAGSIITRECLKTGEIIKTSTFEQHEGSYSTSINIRSDGRRLSVSGNPSKVNRVDNLFGFSNIDDCFSVYNAILRSLSLPEFTKSTKIESVFNEKTRRFDLVSDGARITQVHVTRNYCVGEANEKKFIRSLGSIAYRKKLGFVYPDNCTVDWNKGSKTLYFKVYSKYHSLIRERKKIAYKLLESDLDYYDRVTNYCKNNGVVRLEYEFKSDFLRFRNLQFWGYNNVSVLFDFGFLENRFNKMSVTVSDFDSIADDLISENIVTSRQSANSTQSYFMMWLYGQNLREKLSNSQFYVHRNRLLALGYDISETCNILTMPLRLKSQSDISLLDLPVPDFYRF